VGDVLRGTFFIALAAVAIDTYYRIRVLIRETHCHASTYGGLAIASLGIIYSPFPLAASTFVGLFLLFLGGRAGLQSLKRSSIRDHLTNLYTRWYFFEEWLPREVKRQERIGGTIAFAMLDVDGLKKVNDEKGHAAGDGVLERFAQAVLANIRGEDIAVRFGGDEVLLAFPGGGEEGARKALEHIARSLGDLSFSFGGERMGRKGRTRRGHPGGRPPHVQGETEEAGKLRELLCGSRKAGNPDHTGRGCPARVLRRESWCSASFCAPRFRIQA
jgi:diguanylate cyclase (GGDEF)-like protein